MRSREMAFALRLPREWPPQTTTFIVYSGHMVPRSVDGHDGLRGSLPMRTTSRRRYFWSCTAGPTCCATSAAPDVGCCAPRSTSLSIFGEPKLARRGGTSRGSSRRAAAARRIRSPSSKRGKWRRASARHSPRSTIDPRKSIDCPSSLMGISPDTVRVRRYRTRRAIAHRLAAFYRFQGSSNSADYGYDAKQAARPRALARRSPHASVAKR
jgi:hypothetical protein